MRRALACALALILTASVARAQSIGGGGPSLCVLSGGVGTVQLAAASSTNAFNYVAEIGSAAAGAGITPQTAQSATSLVGKASPGNLYGAYAILTASASAQTYLVAINATAAPASGASITPVDVAVFPSNAVGAQAALDYKAGPPNAYSTGIVLLVTTSLTTYTPGSASFVLSRVR